MQDELKSQREEGLEAVRRALKDYRRSLDVAGRDVDTAEYTEFNQRQGPAERESSELSLTDLSGNPTFVIGSEVSPLFSSFKRLCITFVIQLLQSDP